jgi:hypothetical protein
MRDASGGLNWNEPQSTDELTPIRLLQDPPEQDNDEDNEEYATTDIHDLGPFSRREFRHDAKARGRLDKTQTCLYANTTSAQVSNGTRKVAIFKAPARAAAG